MKVAVLQMGSRMHYAVPRILHSQGLLERLFTDICVERGPARVLRFLPRATMPKAIRRLRDRRVHGIPPSLIKSFEHLALLATWRISAAGATDHVLMAMNKRFNELVIRHGFAAADALYGYNSASLEAFSVAANAGKKTILEQANAPRRIQTEILRAAAEKYPAWSSASDYWHAASDTAYAAREESEWRVATTIVCGSEFVREGIEKCGGPVEKCVVVPYGVAGGAAGKLTVRTRSKGRLRVLMVGSVGLRKGCPVVADAAAALHDTCEVRVVGPIQCGAEALAHLQRSTEVVGQVPRGEVRKHFEWADVFLLPSLCEGSATVTYEALCAGLPVVCTQNTGSLVQNDRSGLIVPALDADALVRALDSLARDSELYTHLSAGAVAVAPMCGLATYGDRLLREIGR